MHVFYSFSLVVVENLYILVVFVRSIQTRVSSNQRKDLSDSWCDNVSHDA